MAYTNEVLGNVKAICQQFNEAFNLPKERTHGLEVYAVQDGEILLRLNYWELPHKEQETFLRQRFTLRVEEDFDTDCGAIYWMVATELK